MIPRCALPNRRSVLASVAAIGAFAATGARAQANWPDHPVRIIVPYPAGGSTDVLSRILAERMKEMFGQPFVIETAPAPAAISASPLSPAARPTATQLVPPPSATSRLINISTARCRTTPSATWCRHR